MLLRSFESFEKTENGYLIHGDAADVKLIFMTDDIIRVRVHFDKGTPMEEESYTLVTTAWPDRMDDLLKDERTRIIEDFEISSFEIDKDDEIRLLRSAVTERLADLLAGQKTAAPLRRTSVPTRAWLLPAMAATAWWKATMGCAAFATRAAKKTRPWWATACCGAPPPRARARRVR